MVIGMATTKITITLRDEQLKDVRAMVESGQASSVSAFVQHAVSVALSDAAGWKEMLEEAVQQTGGPLTPKELVWADSLLTTNARKKGRRKVA